MAKKILPEDYENRIRYKLGVDEPYLSNEVINSPDIIDVAELNIINMLPDYTAVSEDNKVYLEAAVVIECCILLCVGMPSRLPKKQSGPHESHELDSDWLKKKAMLEEERNALIGRIIESDFLEIQMGGASIFTVTCPKRPWERR